MHYIGNEADQIGNEADWREIEDSVKRAIIIADPTQRVRERGQIVAWDVYTTRGRRSQTVHLKIFCTWRLTYLPRDPVRSRCRSATVVPGAGARCHGDYK